jgi:CheY-like chemotaxis protein
VILLSMVADEEAGKFLGAVDCLAKPVSERVQLPHVGRVIVLDIRMPQMDGIAARHALRANDQTRRVPMIRMTGYVGTLEANRSTTAELDAPLILTKPFAAERLVTALAQTLARRDPA